MSDTRLSLPETAALLVLMREAGEVSNPELQERYGLTLTGKERHHLNSLKLVDSWKQGRAYAHVLTDLGWARLSEELRDGIDRPGGSAGSALHAVLGGLQAFMDRTDHRLADIFAAPLDAAIPQAPSPAVGLQARIRAAYAELAGRPGTYVGLIALRSLLRDVPRAAVDNALRLMNRLPDVNIVPESNQKTLTPEQREAAVIIGDQEKHVLWIGA